MLVSFFPSLHVWEVNPCHPTVLQSPVLTHAARPPTPPIYNTSYHMCNTVCMHARICIVVSYMNWSVYYIMHNIINLLLACSYIHDTENGYEDYREGVNGSNWIASSAQCICAYLYIAIGSRIMHINSLLMWQKHVTEAAQPVLSYWSQRKWKETKWESKEGNRQNNVPSWCQAIRD